MAVFTDNRGRSYTVNSEAPLATGGEGDICTISNDSRRVAKLFHPDSPALKKGEMEKKITYMVNLFLGTNDKTRDIISHQITWPEAVLKDSSGRFRGYVMQKITDHETLQEAYSTSERVKTNFNFRERVRIAKNLCIAVNVMHQLRCVVGDFNAKNIMVSIKKGTVYLVDSDSFHLLAEETVRGRNVRKYYPTVVGRPEYLPKELHDYLKKQNAQLDNVSQPSFNRESDLFALAIHIFSLLMYGVHPYGLRVNPANPVQSVSRVDVGWVTNIKLSRYVYSDKPELKSIRDQYAPPEFAPPIDIIPKSIRELFDKAFAVGQAEQQQLARRSGDNNYYAEKSVRPSASEWYQALDKLEKSLCACSREQSHFYSSHLAECPWCKKKQCTNNTQTKQKVMPKTQGPFTSPHPSNTQNHNASQRSNVSGLPSSLSHPGQSVLNMNLQIPDIGNGAFPDMGHEFQMPDYNDFFSGKEHLQIPDIGNGAFPDMEHEFQMPDYNDFFSGKEQQNSHDPEVMMKNMQDRLKKFFK